MALLALKPQAASCNQARLQPGRRQGVPNRLLSALSRAPGVVGGRCRRTPPSLLPPRAQPGEDAELALLELPELEGFDHIAAGKAVAAATNRYCAWLLLGWAERRGTDGAGRVD